MKVCLACLLRQVFLRIWEMYPDMPKVAVVEFDANVSESFRQALELVGGISDLNTGKRSVVVKVGVFDPKKETHSSVSVVDAIINGFDKTPQFYLAESDNYRGTGSERLQIWKNLFSKRVIPFNLSEDKEVKKVAIAGEEMSLSHILFKPNVLVSTHVLRSYEKGSILKNLFGLVPGKKKAKYHKNLVNVLLDIYEAVGGIDLAVLDGTYFCGGTGATLPAKEYRAETKTLLVGRDAVAVETVGATLAGSNPEEMPIIQEAMKRGLGEGQLENIDVVGKPFEEVKEKFRLAARSHNKKGVVRF